MLNVQSYNNSDKPLKGDHNGITNDNLYTTIIKRPNLLKLTDNFLNRSHLKMYLTTKKNCNHFKIIPFKKDFNTSSIRTRRLKRLFNLTTLINSSYEQLFNNNNLTQLIQGE